jgi:hypothetical protein
MVKKLLIKIPFMLQDYLKYICLFLFKLPATKKERDRGGDRSLLLLCDVT